MGRLITCAAPFSLDDLAARIRKSSNFRFSWQFFQAEEIALQSPADIRSAVDSIIVTPNLHRFLQETFQATYDDVFKIEPLHEHCQVATASGEFENTLASAGGDHLGAYSRKLRRANASEIQEIQDLFGCIGRYSTFELLPGKSSDCPTCRSYSNHLFTTWFYGVAWDWCLLASWPSRDLLWMGCLTDTD